MGVPERYYVAIADAEVERIRARLDPALVAYAPADATGWQYGTNATYLREFVKYWRDRYDWPAAQRELNRFAQFRCEVAGIPIHFLHIRGTEKRPTLLLTHGWPGSTYEFHAAAARLSENFDLVIPSLPGYGFSGRPERPIGPRRIAEMWRALMVDHLGIARFGVQGGDWGSAVSSWLANDAPAHVVGLHLNLCAPQPGAAPHPAETAWREEMAAVMRAESAYMFEQMTKPQTIALALAASPVGYAAWVLEKFQGWGDTGGDIEQRFSKDWLITNLMIHLVNDAVPSMIWSYRGALEEIMAGQAGGMRVTVPTAFAHFPAEFLPAPPREVAERYFHIVRWTKMQAGGHFAALEEPDSFASDVGEFFGGLDFA